MDFKLLRTLNEIIEVGRKEGKKERGKEGKGKDVKKQIGKKERRKSHELISCVALVSPACLCTSSCITIQTLNKESEFVMF